MTKLEENHSGKAKLLDSLQSELSSTETQQNKLEQEVGGRRDSLATDEKQLRVSAIAQHLPVVGDIALMITHLCRVRYRRR